MPYDRMPRPRFFGAAGKDAEYLPTYLPRRPRSPVRQLLPGEFDLEAAFRELERQRESIGEGGYLRESKDRLERSLRRFSQEQVDADVLISFLVVYEVCEEVSLAAIGGRIGKEARLIANVAVVWALADAQLLDRGVQSDEQLRISSEWGLSDYKGRKKLVADFGTFDFRRMLFEAYRPRFCRFAFPSMHRRLPWPYVAPAHQQGQARFYPNARERIDERTIEAEGGFKSAYVPDLTCFHLREVPDKAYVAYRRRSKSLSLPRKSKFPEDEDLLLQLVSFM
ncbi:hypothetical protein KM043_010695 [Ampulex compressa]|nr:hypothetical protein KM043_010695 [Ampulex compressa]